MSTPTVPATAGVADVAESPGRRRRRRRRVAAPTGAVLAVAVLAAAGVTAAGLGPLARGAAGTAAPASVDSTAATALATVTRTTLSARTTEDATLGYSGTYNVVNQAHGTLTALPAVGQLVKRGQVLYRVDGAPVVLLLGRVPAYRTLSKDATGADVQQLNANLVALGMATTDELDPTGTKFTSATVTAVKKLQDALDVEQTGSLALGQAAFLPSAARVTAVQATLGTPAGPGAVVLQASSSARIATITLDAAAQGEFAKGDKVTITLPDGRTTPGVVSWVSKVATKPAADANSDAKSTVTVTVTPTRPAQTGTDDEAPATVSIVTQSVRNVLTVPVTALLALAGGGYAVEVDAAGSRRLVAVALGLFDDDAGLVQVTGTGLAAGQHVVVPAS